MKEFNFIWDGDFPHKRTVSEHSRLTIPANIEHWCKQFAHRSDVKINLWIGPNANKDEFIRWKRESGLDNLNFKYIQKTMDKYAYYATKGPWPNYGLASDIWRVHIIGDESEGDCIKMYIDCDNEFCGENPEDADDFLRDLESSIARKKILCLAEYNYGLNIKSGNSIYISGDAKKFKKYFPHITSTRKTFLSTKDGGNTDFHYSYSEINYDNRLSRKTYYLLSSNNIWIYSGCAGYSILGNCPEPGNQTISQYGPCLYYKNFKKMIEDEEKIKFKNDWRYESNPNCFRL